MDARVRTTAAKGIEFAKAGSPGAFGRPLVLPESRGRSLVAERPAEPGGVAVSMARLLSYSCTLSPIFSTGWFAPMNPYLSSFPRTRIVLRAATTGTPAAGIDSGPRGSG